MRDVVGVSSRLGAPYYLSEGSLLYLYRDCDLGQSDLDLVLDLAWWNKTNSQALQEELAALGFTRTLVFGQLEEVGYEESYNKKATVVGWGLFKTGSGLSPFLKKVELTVSPPKNDQCKLISTIVSKNKNGEPKRYRTFLFCPCSFFHWHSAFFLFTFFCTL